MKSKLINQNIAVCFMVVVLLLFMTIGYASFNEELELEANIKLVDVFTKDSISLETEYKYVNTLSNDGVIISVEIEKEKSSNTFLKVKNNSEKTLTYKGNRSLYEGSNYPMIKGILPGDFLLPNEEKVIYIKNIDNVSLGNMTIEFEFLFNAVDVLKPVIITDVEKTTIDLINNEGTLDIDIMNLYDSSIELEVYFNDSDLGVKLEKRILYLNKGENKHFSLNIYGNIIDDSISTTLYARVLSKEAVDDTYVIENIIIKKDV